MAQKPALFWKFYCPLYLLQDMVLHSTVFWLIFQSLEHNKVSQIHLYLLCMTLEMPPQNAIV